MKVFRIESITSVIFRPRIAQQAISVNRAELSTPNCLGLSKLSSKTPPPSLSCPRSGFLPVLVASLPLPSRFSMSAKRFSCFSMLTFHPHPIRPQGAPHFVLLPSYFFLLTFCGEPKLRHPRNRFTASRAPAFPCKSILHQPSSRYTIHGVHALGTSAAL